MALAAPMYDWDELDDSLESKFREYNGKFNSDKVAVDDMTFSSWKNFTGNISFSYISRCDIYDVLHSCGKGPEGSKILQFRQFKAALKKLFDRERSRQYANSSSEVSEKVLLSKVISSPVHSFSVSRCLKFLLAATSENEPNIAKHAAELGATLKVMATNSISELTDIGVGATWVGPVVGVLKSIWEHLKAYRDIPGVLLHFGAMLTYLTDALVFIERNNLYSEKITISRLKGLEDILEDSKRLFEKANKKSGKNKKVRKFFAAKKYLERLKDQEAKIGNWMLMIYFMQLAENQRLNKEMHSDIKEVLTAVVQTNFNVKCLGEMFVTFLFGIYHRGLDEDGLRKTVEEICRRFDISPPDEGVNVPGRVMPSQVQENLGRPGVGIQASSQGDAGQIEAGDKGASGLIQAADEGAGGPVSYMIQAEAFPWSREGASMQMTPSGPKLQMPRPKKKRQTSHSPRTSQTPRDGPFGSNSPSASRHMNFADIQPHSDGEIGPVPVIPTAPPESIPPDQNPGNTPPSENQASHTNPQATGEGHSEGNQGIVPLVERLPLERPLPSNTSPTGLVLKDGEDISDVLLWISDHFGNSGFINFARSLPGPKRLTTGDIEAAEYDLGRHHSLSERNMAVLEYWHQRNPDHCTVDTMYQMLRKMSKNEMAKNLKEKWCHLGAASPSVNTASGGASQDVTNHTDRLVYSLSNIATVPVSAKPGLTLRVVTASGKPSDKNTYLATPLCNTTSGAGAVAEEDFDFTDGVNYREYDILILHEKEDKKDVEDLRQRIMGRLKGAEVAILDDFDTEGTRPRPLQAGLEKSTVVAFYVSNNTARKNRENSIVADLNFELVNESKLKAFLIYKTDGAKVKELLKSDTPYLRLLANASATYNVLATDFMKKMNGWFQNHKHLTEERRKKNLPTSRYC